MIVVGVGAVVARRGAVLLVQRSKEPGKGLWAIPGGRMVFGETLKQVAEREVREETGLNVEAEGKAFYGFDVRVNDELQYVVVDVKAVCKDEKQEPVAGDDALDARFFDQKTFEEMGDKIVKETRLLLIERMRFFD